MISIIIPCYNESARLPATLAEIQDYINRSPKWSKFGDRITEVIVVDDGSRDSTVERALYFQDKLPLKVIQHAKNTGKWAAIHTGMVAAKSDWVLLLDADGSAAIQNLNKIPRGSLERQRVAFFGSRFLPSSTVQGKSMFRTMVSSVYRAYARVLCKSVKGFAPNDLQAPFKLFRKSDVWGELNVDRFAGDIELFCALRSSIKDVPLDFVHKLGSKVRASAVVSMAYQSYHIASYYRKASKK